MAKKQLPSPELLRKLLRYEPDIGKLFWLPRPLELCSDERAMNSFNALHGGREAFTADNGDGYRMGRLFGRPFKAHRVVWAIYYGEWPKDQIDHINGVRSDNRLCNLRAATHAQNARNARHSSLNTSGFRGVNKVTGKQVWQARIAVDGRRICLGTFRTPEAAHDAYKIASKLYHGEFGRA